MSSDKNRQTIFVILHQLHVVLQTIFVLLLPVIVVLALSETRRLYKEEGPSTSDVFAALLTGEILVASLVVAQWYQNLARSREIAMLRRLAFAYQLGETVALRPFLVPSEQRLSRNSSLKDYEKKVAEPEVFKEKSGPLFFLAVFLVLSLGLMPFWAKWMEIAESPNFLLGGPVLARYYHPDTDGPDWMRVPVANRTDAALNHIITYQYGALVCLSFAFLGAYLSCITYLFRRITLNDVNANAYQTISVRLLGSAIVALMLYHCFHLLQGTGTPPQEPGSDLPGGSGLGEAGIVTPVIGAVAPMLGINTGVVVSEVAVLASFLAGIMPEMALRRMMEWVLQSLRGTSNPSGREDTPSLERIEGIDMYTRMRLEEMGIYDAHGLVSTNPLYLYLRTPYHLLQVMDWIGQAFALIHLQPEQWKEARALGIRTAWQIEERFPKPEKVSDNGQQPSSLDELMRNVSLLLNADPAYRRAKQIVECMCDVPNDEEATSTGQERKERRSRFSSSQIAKRATPIATT